MRICYSGKFAREYRKLPPAVKNMAEKKEQIFRQNPFDECLGTHKLKGALKDFYSFSINNKYRIIFEFISREESWFHSVGSHSIYGLWD